MIQSEYVSASGYDQTIYSVAFGKAYDSHSFHPIHTLLARIHLSTIHCTNQMTKALSDGKFLGSILDEKTCID